MVAWAEIVAYVRREEGAAEYAHPLNKVWACIPEVVAGLGWGVEAVDDVAHRVRVKTWSGLFAWGSVFLIDVVAVSDGTTRVNVRAETPVTAITGLVDFGRTGQMIGVFFQELQRQLG